MTAYWPMFQGATPPVARYTREGLRDPAVGAEDRRNGAVAQAFAPGRDVPGEWWTLFRSRALNSLVAEALARNPTLEAAQAALRAARATTEAQRGALFPQVAFAAQSSYNKAPGGELQSPLNDNSLLYSLVTPQVTVSFAPDVFGGTRRALESQAAQEEVQRWQLEAAYLTLTANVVAAAIQEAALRAQIAATEKVIQAQTELLSLITKQSDAGQVAGADVVQLVSALLRHGPGVVDTMRTGLEDWMAERKVDTLAGLRGCASLAGLDDPLAFERASYLRTLTSWH